ncbi:MAG: 23S rRNA (adenine(2503)-C(2))-methyltransferase RlmN [Lachnospiraceae bacterium]|nr:23S rRNA (adenine(2503)-C(2))-methyltransferase RlmN [Lachnospiraceae bacterium]
MSTKDSRRNIRELDYEGIKALVESLGEKSFRAKQLYDWLHVKCADGFGEMTDLSLSLRQKLEAAYDASLPEAVKIQESKLDGTKKYLFALKDGQLIEAVKMEYHHGVSVCISTQVGCRMGCAFCASTLGGLVRNLSRAEMLSEIYAITRLEGKRISNIVMMGIGEPLDNYDEAVAFLHMISDERGMNISPRNITISTCGLVPGIMKLAEEKLPVTLALSLHAADDEKRKKIMPVAKSYSIAELMEACDSYFEKTGRRISFEYALIKGENDSDEDAARLAGLAAKRRVHVNLIPVNPVTERGLTQPDGAAVRAFLKKLQDKNVTATVRRELGRDIDGACGQLRRKSL